MSSRITAIFLLTAICAMGQESSNEQDLRKYRNGSPLSSCIVMDSLTNLKKVTYLDSFGISIGQLTLEGHQRIDGTDIFFNKIKSVYTGIKRKEFFSQGVKDSIYYFDTMGSFESKILFKNNKPFQGTLKTNRRHPKLMTLEERNLTLTRNQESYCAPTH